MYSLFEGFREKLQFSLNIFSLTAFTLIRFAYIFAANSCLFCNNPFHYKHNRKLEKITDKSMHHLYLNVKRFVVTRFYKHIINAYTYTCTDTKRKIKHKKVYTYFSKIRFHPSFKPNLFSVVCELVSIPFALLDTAMQLGSSARGAF